MRFLVIICNPNDDCVGKNYKENLKKISSIFSKFLKQENYFLLSNLDDVTCLDKIFFGASALTFGQLLFVFLQKIEKCSKGSKKEHGVIFVTSQTFELNTAEFF